MVSYNLRLTIHDMQYCVIIYLFNIIKYIYLLKTKSTLTAFIGIKSQVLLIKCTDNLSSVSVSNSSFVSLLVWSIQVCVNTMPRRKDISNDLREAIVAAHRSEKGYKDISKLFRVRHSTERLFPKGKHSRQLSIPRVVV